MTLALLPPPHHAIIDRAVLADGTRRNYKRAIDRMIAARVDPRDTPALIAYVRGLPKSIQRNTQAALVLLYQDVQVGLEAGATAGNLADTQAALLNLAAMRKAVSVRDQAGSRPHVWLSREQVEAITSLPDRTTVRGLRDYIVLAVLVAAGLRREEMTGLKFADLLQQPAKTGMRDVLSVLGKGGKRRSVPISTHLAATLREWHKLAGDGYVARSINKGGVVNGSLSAIGVHNIVRQYGAMIGIPALDAHDMRRTYARLGYDAGVAVEQISRLLGHANVKTTMIYLGIEIDIESTISDFIPLA